MMLKLVVLSCLLLSSASARHIRAANHHIDDPENVAAVEESPPTEVRKMEDSPKMAEEETQVIAPEVVENAELPKPIWYFGPIVQDTRDPQGRLAVLQFNLSDIPTPEEILSNISATLTVKLEDMKLGIQSLINRLEEIQQALKPSI